MSKDKSLLHDYMRGRIVGIIEDKYFNVMLDGSDTILSCILSSVLSRVYKLKVCVGDVVSIYSENGCNIIAVREIERIILEDEAMSRLGIDCVKLQNAVPVKWMEGQSQKWYEIVVKYISISGVAFNKVINGRCTWIRLSYGTQCVMPDGTTFVCESENKKWLTEEDKQKFKQSIIDWVENNKDFFKQGV